MWAEKTPAGKIKFVERYEDPMTGKSRKVSCTMDKDTRTTRKAAAQILDAEIQKRLTAAPSADHSLTLSGLVDLYRGPETERKAIHLLPELFCLQTLD